MEQEYSPEKWAINDVGNSLIYSEETALNVARVFGINKDANARRIVACVNACEGFETEFLERSGNDIFRKSEERFDKALGKISRLLQQNAELVQTLKEIMCEMPIEPKLALTKRIIEIVEAALAKYE